MNDADMIISHIRSLKTQLRALKAQLESPREFPVRPSQSFNPLPDPSIDRFGDTPGDPDTLLYPSPEDEDDYI